MKFDSPNCGREPTANRGGRLLLMWFSSYHWLKRSYFNQPAKPSVKRVSMFEAFSANRITFAASFAALVAALVLHVILPPYLSEPPLAIFGCSLLSLVVNGRWGTIAAIFYCVMLFVMKIHFHIEPFGMAALLWNFMMRFLFLEIYVVLFDFVRRQASSLPKE